MPLNLLAKLELLYSCTEEEIMKIYEVHNRTQMQKGILIQRPLKHENCIK